MSTKADILAKMLLNSMDTQFQKNTIDDGFCMGTVINLEPLIIEVDGLKLYEKDLYINKYLLPWREYCGGLTTVAGSPPHQHGMIYIDHPSKFKIGYTVAMYGMEWNLDGKTYQKYCVLSVIN